MSPRALLAILATLAASVLVAPVAACRADSSSARATPTPAPVFPGSASLSRAQALAARGKLAEAADALSEAQRELDEAAPLRIQNLTVVEGAVRGYGLYEPKPDGVVVAGAPLVVYFEPAGMARQREGELWKMNLVADVAVLDAAGDRIVSQTDFLRSAVTSRRPNRELQFTLRLDIEGAPAGDYLVEVTLRDLLGKEQAVERVPFKIRLP